MGVGDKTRPDEQRPDGQRRVAELLTREFEFCARVAVVQFDTPRHLGDVMMLTELFLTALFVLDDEGIVQPVVVDLFPVRLQFGPNARPKIILQGFKKSWADLGQRQLSTRDGVVWMCVESATCFCGSDECSTELWGEALEGKHFVRDYFERTVVDYILVTEDAFDIAKGPIGGSCSHVINVRTPCIRLAGFLNQP